MLTSVTGVPTSVVSSEAAVTLDARCDYSVRLQLSRDVSVNASSDRSERAVTLPGEIIQIVCI